MSRIHALDIARSLALLLMAVFHFTFDLELFGLIAPGTISSPEWRWFAKGIAASFVFLSGVSLWLAHGNGLRWRPFWQRFVKVAGAAVLVSLATFVAIPDTFIYFGILHCIALSALVCLPFLRMPAGVTALAAVAFFLAPRLGTGLPGGDIWLDWTGLTGQPRPSVDYVPVFPWAGWALAGLAVARHADSAGIFDRLRALGGQGRLTWWLGWPGRHSLAVYLLHQPVLIAVLWIALQLGLAG